MLPETMYTHETTIRLRDTDAAGVVYFSAAFDLAHEAFEAFMDSVGMDIGIILRSNAYDLPIVNAEARFIKPMFAGDRIRIGVLVTRMGETSFTLSYRFRNRGDEETVYASITHVVVHRVERKKIAIPKELGAALSEISGMGDAQISP